MLSGWAPPCAQVHAWRTECGAPRDLPPREGSFTICWTDGSAVCGRDPALRTAGWAVAWIIDGEWKFQVGKCIGRQTVGRAELCAALWAAETTASSGGCIVVTDCKYVADGISDLLAGSTKRLFDGEDADLWLRMAAAPVLARWVPAHLAYDTALRRGVSPADWLGNDLVDRVARATAQLHGPPAELIAVRATRLDALGALQRNLAAMQQLQLESSKRRGLRVRKRIRARTAPARPAPKARRKVRVAAGEAVPDPPPGAHHLYWEIGPLPARGAAARSHPALACTLCGRSATGPKAWRKLVVTPCAWPGGPVVDANKPDKHCLVASGDLWQCTWCGSAWPGEQRARVARRACRVPWFVSGGRPAPDITRWAARWLECLERRVAGDSRAVGPDDTAPTAPRWGSLVAYRAHVGLHPMGPGQHRCLLCPRSAASSDALYATACPGRCGDGRRRGTVLALRAGLYDHQIPGMAAVHRAEVARLVGRDDGPWLRAMAHLQAARPRKCPGIPAAARAASRGTLDWYFRAGAARQRPTGAGSGEMVGIPRPSAGGVSHVRPAGRVAVEGPGSHELGCAQAKGAGEASGVHRPQDADHAAETVQPGADRDGDVGRRSADDGDIFGEGPLQHRPDQAPHSAPPLECGTGPPSAERPRHGRDVACAARDTCDHGSSAVDGDAPRGALGTPPLECGTNPPCAKRPRRGGSVIGPVRGPSGHSSSAGDGSDPQGVSSARAMVSVPRPGVLSRAAVEPAAAAAALPSSAIAVDEGRAAPPLVCGNGSPPTKRRRTGIYSGTLDSWIVRRSSSAGAGENAGAVGAGPGSRAARVTPGPAGSLVYAANVEAADSAARAAHSSARAARCTAGRPPKAGRSPRSCPGGRDLEWSTCEGGGPPGGVESLCRGEALDPHAARAGESVASAASHSPSGPVGEARQGRAERCPPWSAPGQLPGDRASASGPGSARANRPGPPRTGPQAGPAPPRRDLAWSTCGGRGDPGPVSLGAGVEPRAPLTAAGGTACGHPPRAGLARAAGSRVESLLDLQRPPACGGAASARGEVPPAAGGPPQEGADVRDRCAGALGLEWPQRGGPASARSLAWLPAPGRAAGGDTPRSDGAVASAARLPRARLACRGGPPAPSGTSPLSSEARCVGSPEGGSATPSDADRGAEGPGAVQGRGHWTWGQGPWGPRPDLGTGGEGAPTPEGGGQAHRRGPALAWEGPLPGGAAGLRARGAAHPSAVMADQESGGFPTAKRFRPA